MQSNCKIEELLDWMKRPENYIETKNLVHLDSIFLGLTVGISQIWK